MVQVYFIYAETPTKLWTSSLQLAEGSTLAEAFAACSFHQMYPDTQLEDLGFSVFGRKVSKDYILMNNDRIELCRPLTFDPMVSRKRRAAHRNAGILKRKHLKPDRARKIDVDVHAD